MGIMFSEKFTVNFTVSPKLYSAVVGPIILTIVGAFVSNAWLAEISTSDDSIFPAVSVMPEAKPGVELALTATEIWPLATSAVGANSKV